MPSTCFRFSHAAPLLERGVEAKRAPAWIADLHAYEPFTGDLGAATTPVAPVQVEGAVGADPTPTQRRGELGDDGAAGGAAPGGEASTAAAGINIKRER
jgi:hypothetical protein